MPRERDECWQEISRLLDPSGKRHHRNTCKHCSAEWTSNEKARVIEHLQRCPELPESLWRIYQPHRLDPTLPSAGELRQQRLARTKGISSMSTTEQDIAVAACAQWINAAGLSPNVMEHPAFRAFLHTLRPAFRPPTRHQLTHAMVDAPLMFIAYVADPQERLRRPSILDSSEETQSRSLQAFLLKYCDGDGHKASVLLGMLSLLRIKQGPFNNDMVWIAAERMTPIQWWHDFWLQEQPDLAQLCMLALAIVPVGDATERNWSPHSFTHALKQYQLNPETVSKLVNAFWSLRIKHGWVDDTVNGAVLPMEQDTDFTTNDMDGFIGMHGYANMPSQ